MPTDDRPSETGAMSSPTRADLSFFEVHPDMIVGIDSQGSIVYVNPTMSAALGIDSSTAVGQSIAEFLHPDDFAKALESVAGLSDTPDLGVPITPIIFRLRRSDGDYMPVECNGTVVGAGPFAEWMIIVGRYPGDHLLELRIGEMLTSGVDLPEIISVIPEFGLWRHPGQYYAISYRTDSGTVWTGSDAAVAIGRAHAGSDTPWARASAAGDRLDFERDDLTPEMRDMAGELGVERCGLGSGRRVVEHRRPRAVGPSSLGRADGQGAFPCSALAPVHHPAGCPEQIGRIGSDHRWIGP